jgi:hypothetical protein
MKIAAFEEIGGGNYGSAHGSRFVGALSPRNITGDPERETHSPVVFCYRLSRLRLDIVAQDEMRRPVPDHASR